MTDLHTANTTIAQQIIAGHQETNLPKLITDEIGANMSVAHTIMGQSGSSKVIDIATSNYNQAHQWWNTNSYRSVSPQFIQAALLGYKTRYPENNIFINSFQVGNDPQVVTHGYIGIDAGNGGKIVHVTIPQMLERPEYQHIIGNIGLQLINNFVSGEGITTPHIDQIFQLQGEHITQDIKSTIEHMQSQSMVCVDVSGNLCRIEDLTRTREGYQPLILYKGSFNPIHNGHLHVMQQTQTKYPHHKAIFSISIDTYGKNKVDSDNIINRVRLLNKLGYPIVLFGSGYFKDNIDLLRHKNNQEIILPVGSDTIPRILEGYTGANIDQQMMSDFPNVHFEEFSKAGFKPSQYEFPSSFLTKHGSNFEDVHAREIRKNIGDYLDKIPEAIHDECVAIYSSAIS